MGNKIQSVTQDKRVDSNCEIELLVFKPVRNLVLKFIRCLLGTDMAAQ